MTRSLTGLLATLCLLAVWIATPLLSVAHVLLVEHRFCAEHERLEEGEDLHAPGDERVVEEDESSRVASGHPVDTEAAHEGCAFGESFTLEDGFLLPADSYVEPVLSLETRALVPSATSAQTLPILHVAPKGSPPLVA